MVRQDQDPSEHKISSDFTSKAMSAIPAQKSALNQESFSDDEDGDGKTSKSKTAAGGGFMTSVPEEPEEEDTTKFYNGYMARVVALQEMTKEFNRELAEIEDSDDDAQNKKRKKKAAAAA